jgi:outer membrane protein assembly factor BamD
MVLLRRLLLRPLTLASTLLLGVGLPLGGCKAFETNLQDTEVDELDTARQNFEAGEASFSSARWQEAIKYFELVKNKYPYSKYAVLADLRLADAHFAREKWLEAADAYRLFVRYHPRHEQVAYATFRVAESHSRAVDDNVAWLPFVDARQKDQSAARDTIRACDEFLTRFPNDKNAKTARALRTAARARLADADLFAAAFYEKRSRWQGAQWRYARVGNDYGDTPGAARALWKAGLLARDRLDDHAAARQSWEKLIAEHPEAPEAKEARSALGALSATPQPAAPSAPSSGGPDGAATAERAAAQGAPDADEARPPSADDAGDDGQADPDSAASP